MSHTFRGTVVEREQLPDALTQLTRRLLDNNAFEQLASREPPSRGGVLGTWSGTSSDTLAEILIVRDRDLSETLTWLGAFFSGLAPITQWCRVIPYSAAERMAQRHQDVNLGSTLSLWVGAILAECSVQAGGAQNLRDLPGSAALSTATYAAGRASAVWFEAADYSEIAKRHDELSSAILRESTRPLAAEKLTPIWRVISGETASLSMQERRSLQPLLSLLLHINDMRAGLDAADLVSQIAFQARQFFDIPEIVECAYGPQSSRVQALDRLGEKLLHGPSSPSVEALLGLGASFIDPGATISSELLRRYSKIFPTAPIWQGVFAGAIAPLRTMTDHGGLGRLIAKSLLERDDLTGRPSCDVSFEELIRFVTPDRPLKFDVRGNHSRSLSVELTLGVTCSFPYNRTASNSSINQRTAAYPISRSRPAATDTSNIENALRELELRISDVENMIQSQQKSLDFGTENKRSPRRSTRSITNKK